MPFTPQSKMKHNLSMTRRVNLSWRPELGLLQPKKQQAFIVAGKPKFDTPWDPWASRPTSRRTYNAPDRRTKADTDPLHYSMDFQYQPQPANKKDDTLTPCFPVHGLLGKFRFEVNGMFHQRGELAEKETFDTACNLSLMGWFKARERFLLGHLQGDVYALSYFQRWLEEKHLSLEAGRIDAVRIFEVSTGLPSPLAYPRLLVVKDLRKYGKIKQHLLMKLEKQQVTRLQRESTLRMRAEEDKLSEARTSTRRV
mmetsp:Transcript_56028/g.103681  ORF Transcript_56028/g.103681 Transcript_56028/m.103681 type:complete len:254 (-) Transcript_56028:53-814(-)